MNWTELDWKALDRLRDQFLNGKPGDGPYWEGESDLSSYDATFGERIGFKWDAVLAELNLHRWKPRPGPVLDWGCGSGIAGRRVYRAALVDPSSPLVVWDRSPAAALFAHDAARREFPSLDVTVATPGYLSGDEPIGLLVLSHVLNELSPEDLDGLRRLAARSGAVVWTEPGTREVARRMSALRDELLGPFKAVAPCTHDGPCPMLEAAHERHWCHHFAPPPPQIFADSNWVKFGQRAGIDLRSLPYSFIALDRHLQTRAQGLSRVVGRAEHFKPYARLLSCDRGGLATLTVPKRTSPALFKELDRTKAPLVYRWVREGAQITEGRRLEP